MSQNGGMPSGPPYTPQVASVGGRPTVAVDVAPLAVFIFLYATFAACNMTIFQLNQRRAYKFIPSVATFGFCMSRIVTCSLRIAWALHPRNARLAIAAQIFVNAGILIIYIINIIFAQRILRSMKPRLGWQPLLRVSFKIVYVLIAALLIMLITAIVISSYTLNQHTRQICRDLQLTGITYLFVVTVIPLLLLGLAHLPSKAQETDPFGQGSMRSKKLILLWSTCLCITIAGFKLGTLWSTPRPLTMPAWYHSKAAFYVFNFTLEILILVVITASRIDKRFFVPNGSNAPGDYTRLADKRPGSNAMSDTEAASDLDVEGRGIAQLEK